MIFIGIHTVAVATALVTGKHIGTAAGGMYLKGSAGGIHGGGIEHSSRLRNRHRAAAGSGAQGEILAGTLILQGEAAARLELQRPDDRQVFRGDDAISGGRGGIFQPATVDGIIHGLDVIICTGGAVQGADHIVTIAQGIGQAEGSALQLAAAGIVVGIGSAADRASAVYIVMGDDRDGDGAKGLAAIITGFSGRAGSGAGGIDRSGRGIGMAAGGGSAYGDQGQILLLAALIPGKIVRSGRSIEGKITLCIGSSEMDIVSSAVGSYGKIEGRSHSYQGAGVAGGIAQILIVAGDALSIEQVSAIGILLQDKDLIGLCGGNGSGQCGQAGVHSGIALGGGSAQVIGHVVIVAAGTDGSNIVAAGIVAGAGRGIGCAAHSASAVYIVMIDLCGGRAGGHSNAAIIADHVAGIAGGGTGSRHHTGQGGVRMGAGCAGGFALIQLDCRLRRGVAGETGAAGIILELTSGIGSVLNHCIAIGIKGHIPGGIGIERGTGLQGVAGSPGDVIAAVFEGVGSAAAAGDDLKGHSARRATGIGSGNAVDGAGGAEGRQFLRHRLANKDYGIAHSNGSCLGVRSCACAEGDGRYQRQYHAQYQ